MMDPSTDEAYEALFRVEYPGLLRLATLISGDRDLGREVTQEAFTRLWMHWPRVSRYDRPGAWLRRVTIRLAVRARPRPVLLDDRSSAMATAGPAGTDVVLDVRRAVLSLPAGQRAAVVLHYFEDRPVEEVAALMGCRASTARVHLHRARQRLAHLLDDPDDPPRSDDSHDSPVAHDAFMNAQEQRHGSR
jgi:DNA-directed RNA polymerase specialized sigma24 family protein